ncbi:hypothetical protein MD588_21670 [Photobacterium sp. SDRW27]|uniref:hypothetical protein n=1 Tax=Photobacterium obscurum TaxID=2829490 RepID=UPI002242D6C6|nr:hypothetical protein [Photobacterium obscurum]MCW8331406.1 hypothetical protein [Photobacterium obscurum]
MNKFIKKTGLLSLAIILSPTALADGNVRAHYSLENESNEVGAEYNITPVSKVGIIGESLAGTTDIKYTHTFIPVKNLYVSPIVGYFAYSSDNALSPGFEDIVYGRLNVTYAPIKQVALYAEYTDSIAVKDVDLGEVEQLRAGVIIKPVDNLSFVYRYAEQEFVNFFGIETQKNEYWLSYKFTSGLEPYLYAIDQKGADLNVNLGLQYNF